MLRVIRQRRSLIESVFLDVTDEKRSPQIYRAPYRFLLKALFSNGFFYRLNAPRKALRRSIAPKQSHERSE
jgi:hypothetical protein